MLAQLAPPVAVPARCPRSAIRTSFSDISASLVELPAMNTPQFDWARTHRDFLPKPMGAIYRPEVASEAVYRASRLGTREYWVGASTLITIVGHMLAPKFMDWRLM